MEIHLCPENFKEEPKSRQPLPIVAIAVSLVLHLIVAYGFLSGESHQNAEIRPETVRVNLLPRPIRDVPEGAPSSVLTQELEANDVTELLETSASDRQMAEEQAAIETEAEEAELIVEPPAPRLGTANQSARPEPTVALPTVDSINQSLRDVSDSNSSRFYSYRCNPLEEEQGLRECAPGYNSAFAELERSETYRFFNPPVAVSRSKRAQAIVADQAGALSRRLQNGLPSGLSDYVLEELEAGITFNANLGNRAVKHMIDSTDKSEAAGLARQVLDDPVVQSLLRNQRQRQSNLYKPPQ